MTKKDTAALLGCYMLWGFQPLYWGLIGYVGTMTLMPLRIVFAALFSVLILAFQKRTGELRVLFKNKKMMKFLLPAAMFLLADWTVYIILVNSGQYVLSIALLTNHRFLNTEELFVASHCQYEDLLHKNNTLFS